MKNIKVKLLQATPLDVADYAICKCYGNTPHTELEKQQKRINNVANVSKHASTVEHIVYSFDIDGISRAVLQELSRHRHQNLTVKSSRYTLSELKKESPFIIDDEFFNVEGAEKYITLTQNTSVDYFSIRALENLRELVASGVKNDVAKYCMPEAYRTSLVSTFNARALQNFLTLRLDRNALFEIRLLAKAMYEVIPEGHKFLFEEALPKDYETLEAK